MGQGKIGKLFHEGGWMTLRILVSDGISLEGIEALERQAEVIQSDIADFFGEIDAIIVRSRTQLQRETIERYLPRLRVIGRAGVGLDNIDLHAAREFGIAVVNTPEATTVAVAEHTLGMMLAIARHIPQGNVSMKRGDWQKSAFIGSTLNGKLLGIIGVGRIGSALAHLVQGMGMTVLGTDIFKSDAHLRAQGVEPTQLDELLENSDFVSLHIPLNENTRGMISDGALKRMKSDAFLISTARGGIIDESALLTALENGELSGAALDVFEREPPGLTKLIQHPNVIVTPHLAAQTREAQVQTGVDIAQGVLEALT
jgi:D-3-phosphoglycerate dehydrogenase